MKAFYAAFGRFQSLANAPGNQRRLRLRMLARAERQRLVESTAS